MPSGIDASKLADGSVSSAELQFLDGLASNVQTQLNARASTAHHSTHASGGSDPFAVTDLLDAIARSDVTINGASAGKRRKINFINTTGVTWSASDDSTQEAVNISVAGGAVGSDELVKVGTTGTPDHMSDADFEQGAFHIRVKLSTRLKAWTEGEDYEAVSITRDSDGTVSSATVVWPDGSEGTFTRTTKNSTWLAVDAYTITHTSSGQTVAQSAVTRNSGGEVITKPVLTIS
jgi:hypothetical protein